MGSGPILSFTLMLKTVILNMRHEADQTSCSGFKREEAEMSKSELEDCSPSVVKLFRDSVLDGDIDSRLPQLLRSLPSLC